MRLVAAAIGPHEEVGLEIDAEFGQPTLVLGPNNSGKSRLLDLIEAFLLTRRTDHRHATGRDVALRREAAERTAESLEPSLWFELDQLDTPWSWDREFFATHVGPYGLSPQGEASNVDVDVAVAQAIALYEESDDGRGIFRGIDEVTKGEYRELLEVALGACRYVVTGLGFDGWPLAHWPALLASELPEESWESAARLAPKFEGFKTGGWDDPIVWGLNLMRIAARGQRPARPFSPGLFMCDETVTSNCTFPDFEIVRVGPESPSISFLLKRLAECIFDVEGISRPARDPSEIQARGIGEAVYALRSERRRQDWEKLLTDLVDEYTPAFAKGDHSPSVTLSVEFESRAEVALQLSLVPDAEMSLGSGLRNWHAYALAKTASEIRRGRRFVAGQSLFDLPDRQATLPERPLLVLFDEPEAHLHVALQHAVAEWIGEESQRPNQTVIVATHAPAFLGLTSPERRLLPLADGQGREVPSDWKALLDAAGAASANMLEVAQGFLLVEGKDELAIYLACFERELRERNIHIVATRGAFGAAGQAAFLATLGKRVAVVLDRVRREVAADPERRLWVQDISNEEREVRKIQGMGIPNVGCIPFEANDVLQAIPEELMNDALLALGLRVKVAGWCWEEVLDRYREELKLAPSGPKKPDFKAVFLRQLGLHVPQRSARDDRLSAIVAAVCDLIRARVSSPPLIKETFALAVDFLDSAEGKWRVPQP